MKNPKCIIGCDKPARWPKPEESGFQAPLFCSMRCAANHAVEHMMDVTLCPRCGDWSRNCQCTEDELIGSRPGRCREVD